MREYKIIAKAIDIGYYLATYPDVVGSDPVLHYIEFGWREGRNPTENFNSLFYFEKHIKKDVTVNPFYHYILTGKAQNLTGILDEDEFFRLQIPYIREMFDVDYYSSKYGSEIPMGIAPLMYFALVGWKKGHNPNPDFSTSHYLNVSPHLVASRVNPAYHYVRFGKALNISPHPHGEKTINEQIRDDIEPYFDRKYYLKVNWDVRNAGDDPLEHYINYGFKEGRWPNSLFDSSYYLRRNIDIEGWNPLHHYVKHGRNEGRRQNPIGESLLEPPAYPDLDGWMLLPTRIAPNAKLDVIIPVYDGYEETMAAIYAALTSQNKTIFELVIVNDVSPNKKLVDELDRLSRSGLFTLLNNSENLGFPGTVNRGMSLHPDRDVILLNADAYVSGDWIDRMYRHVELVPKVGTITPFSNNATVCSYPQTDKDNVIALEINPTVIDQYLSICNRGRSNALPSGVGFCMFIKRDVLNEIGDFDEAAFGRGYGEENDLCMRVIKAGYLNILAHDIFVQHSGETSFGDTAHAGRQRGERALLRKHPEYNRLVHRYIQADPSWLARLRCDLYRLAMRTQKNKALFVTHTWGGGIKSHVDDLVRGLRAENVQVILFKVGGRGNDSFEIEIVGDEIFTPNLTEAGISRNRDELLLFIKDWLRPDFIHFHAANGLKEGSLANLADILISSGIDLYYTWHDYAPICHRYNLVTPDGRFEGLPSSEVARDRSRVDRKSGEFFEIDAQAASLKRLAQAALINFAPSESIAVTARVYSRPGSVKVKAHLEDLSPLQWIKSPPRNSNPLHIAVIGSIGIHKGADVLYGLVLHSKQANLPIKFTLIGNCDVPEIALLDNIRLAGSYSSLSDCDAEIERSEPHLVLLPSIWPETYMLTLSIALAKGIPPVVFDLGAQGERVRNAGFGLLLDYALARDPKKIAALLLDIHIEKLWSQRKWIQLPKIENVLQDYYEYLTAYS